MVKYKHHPIKILDAGICPKCMRALIAISELEFNYYILDQAGNAHHEHTLFPRYLASCTDKSCGYTSLNWRPINGRFKYMSDYDMYMYENSSRNNNDIPLDIINIVDDPKERTFIGNPFTTEG